MELSQYSTKELSEELSRREGVRVVNFEPHEPFRVWDDTNDEGIKCTGPATILINQD